MRPLHQLGTVGMIVTALVWPVSQPLALAAASTPSYAALGDSYSSGEGNAAFEEGTGDLPGGDGCHRSTWAAWPKYLVNDHPAIDIGDRVNLLACSGATTDALSHPFKGEAAQLSHLKKIAPQPTVITLTIGGNDIGFGDLLTSCYVIGAPACKPKASSMAERIQRQLPGVLDRAYAAVDRAVPKSTRIIVVGYPNIMNRRSLNALLHCSWLNTRANAERLAGLSDQLDGVIRAAAARNKFEYVSTIDAFSGHELCTGDAWVMSLNPQWKQMRGHPLPKGQQALANKVAEYLERYPASFQGQDPAPNQATTAGEQQHYFTARRAGGLTHRFWDPRAGIVGDVWAGPRVAGTPIAYVHGEQQHVFARSLDGRIIHWVWYPGIRGNKPAWSTWAGRGQAKSDPTGFSTATELHVFYRGAKGTLEHRWYNIKVKKHFHDNWGGKVGDSLSGTPAAYTLRDQQHVFARTAKSRLLHYVWYPGIKSNKPRWSIWAGVGQAKSDPAGFSSLTEQHVFFRGPKGTLEHRWYNTRVRKLFHDNWGGKALAGSPIAYTLRNQQHVFSRTARGGLVHFVWYPGIAQNKPRSTSWAGTGLVKSNPAGFSTRIEQHVFYVGSSHKLEHRWFNTQTRRHYHDNWGAV